MMVRRSRQQEGVALITALLITTLATTILASMFWQQQVQIRSMENQRLQSQTKWILRGAMDWVQLILREDLKTPPEVDHLGEPWATGLAETRLDDYVEKDKNAPGNENSDAVLWGGVQDAQARYNLGNLATNTEIQKLELEVYARLLENLQLPPSLALATAKAIAATQQKKDPNQPAGGSDGKGSDGKGSEGGKDDTGKTDGKEGSKGNEPIPNGKTDDKELFGFHYLEDLLTIPGYTPEILQKLKDHVIFLPRIATSITAINVNTCSPEVMAARVPDLNLSVAKALAADAKRGVYFKDVNDFKTRRADIQIKDAPNISVQSNYFLINGKVRLDRATLETQALLERGRHLPNQTRIIWMKEN